MHLLCALERWRAGHKVAGVIHSGAYHSRRAHRPGPLDRPPGRAEAPLWVTQPYRRRVSASPLRFLIA